MKCGASQYKEMEKAGLLSGQALYTAVPVQPTPADNSLISREQHRHTHSVVKQSKQSTFNQKRLEVSLNSSYKQFTVQLVVLYSLV